MTFELELQGSEHKTESNALVAIGGKLPHSFQVPTSKLLDVIVALSSRGRNFTGKHVS